MHTEVVLLSVTDMETIVRNGPQYVPLVKDRTEFKFNYLTSKSGLCHPVGWETTSSSVSLHLLLSPTPGQAPPPKAAAAHRLTHQHLKSAGQVSLQGALQG